MKAHDLIIAILVVLFFVLLAVPYQFEYNFWAETPFLWIAYFVVGGGLAVYIFYLFLQTRRDLIREDEEEKEAQQ